MGHLGVVSALCLSLGLTGAFTLASRANYPGADALTALHELHEAAQSRVSGRPRPVHVHIGVDAAISGVSRFLERPPPWKYSKTEGLQPVTTPYLHPHPN